MRVSLTVPKETREVQMTPLDSRDLVVSQTLSLAYHKSAFSLCQRADDGVVSMLIEKPNLDDYMPAPPEPVLAAPPAAAPPAYTPPAAGRRGTVQEVRFPAAISLTDGILRRRTHRWRDRRALRLW